MRCESCHYRDADFPRDGTWLCIECYDERVEIHRRKIKDREVAHHQEEASAGLI